VKAALPKDRDLAYTSVATIMKILEQKDVLASRKAERAHVYHARLTREEYGTLSLRHLADNVFQGDPGSMVMRLLDESDLSAAELAAIRKVLDERSRPVMTARNLPGLYLQINLLLVISYLLFTAARAAFHPRWSLRVAQGLFLAALLAPLGLALVPAGHLPKPTSFVSHDPASEGARRARAHAARRRAAVPAHVGADPRAEARGLYNEEQLEQLAALLLALGATFAALRLGAGFVRLRRMARGAIILRSLGRVRPARL